VTFVKVNGYRIEPGANLERADLRGVDLEGVSLGDLSAPNVAEDLKVLAQLLNDGLLTKEEFMAAKKLTLES